MIKAKRRRVIDSQLISSYEHYNSTSWLKRDININSVGVVVAVAHRM